jgi:hypothetical protein
LFFIDARAETRAAKLSGVHFFSGAAGHTTTSLPRLNYVGLPIPFTSRTTASAPAMRSLAISWYSGETAHPITKIQVWRSIEFFGQLDAETIGHC